LTGYGERPAYLFIWALGIISTVAVVYAEWFPFVVPAPKHGYADFWYLSSQVFFGKGLSVTFQTIGLSIVQLGEFGCGLVLIALLIASITRKLSP